MRPIEFGRRQRGIGTIAVSVVLLLVMTVAIFYANRNIIFEQRSAANQVRSTAALEMAEGGIEWAIGKLNNGAEIGTNCEPSSGGTSFKRLYVFQGGSTFNPSSLTVGCKRVGTTWTCSCPTSGAVQLPSGSGPSFTVNFATIPTASGAPANYADAVQITAVGCTEHTGTGVCSTTASSNAADAMARVSVHLKLSNWLPNNPPSPIVCGSDCTITASYNVVNNSVGTNGILVNAGDSINIPNMNSVTLDTIPGQPRENALVGNDSSLKNLSSSDSSCSNSSMFRAFFGTTIEEYKNRPSVKIISCGSSSDCKTKMDDAYNAGYRAFYFDSDVHLAGNGTLGSPTDPVVLVTEHAWDINGTWDLYGIVFTNSAVVNDMGTGAANIYGSIVSCQDYRNNGNGTATYDERVFKALFDQGGDFVKVPGSWRDW